MVLVWAEKRFKWGSSVEFDHLLMFTNYVRTSEDANVRVRVESWNENRHNLTLCKTFS